MNAASLHTVLGAGTTGPTAARPTGGVTPAAGQGFTPATAAEAATPAQSEPSAAELLTQIMQALGNEYGEPIRAADGTIYAERSKPNIDGSSIELAFLVIGKFDPATGKLALSEEAVKLAQSKAKAKAEEQSGTQRVLVQIGDKMVWQTISTDESGKPVVTDMKVATEQEIAAHKQQQAAAAAKQGAKDTIQNRSDWQQKIGVVAQNLGLFGSAGQLVMGLSGGPNPYTGKPGAGWISGWILTQRLNGKAEGKLLPEWLQSGPVATALEWGIQAYGMLDMGNDVRIIRDYLNKTPVPPPPTVNAITQQLVAQGQHPAMASALAQAGTELRDGTLKLVEGTGNAAVLNTKLGAVQLMQQGDLHKAFAASDPIKDAGLKLRENVDAGVVKGLGLLKGLVRPAMMGATALGLASSVITVKNLIDTQGARSLVDTKQGRGAVLGALSSAAFLGIYTLPMILPGLGVTGAALAAATSAVNITSNVIGGVQMLNSYGLFGDEGFLNNDALRAAFLIPPLTPIGAFAFWMKKRKQKEADENAKLEAAQAFAVEKVKDQRALAKAQLESAGSISGATRGADGTIRVSTGVPTDLTRLAAQMSGTGAAAKKPAAAA